MLKNVKKSENMLKNQKNVNFFKKNYVWVLKKKALSVII